MRENRIKTIGLTGGTGSGKSAVSRILTGLGAIVIDTDLIARDIVEKGQPALSELIGFFGKHILDPTGELDRKLLGEIVFNDSEKLEILNKITHKYITDKIIKMIADIKENGQTGTVVIEAPIPVKHGFLDIVDEVWVVAASIETRIKRIVQRSGLSLDEAAARVNAQMKSEDYLNLADRVIDNDDSFEKLEKQVINLYQKIQGDIVEKNI